MSFRDIQNPGIGGIDEITDSEAIFLQNITALSYEDGDILYYNSGNLQRLPKGTDGQILTLDSGLPSWASGGSGAVDSVNSQTGVVVLDTSDISDTADKRYVTDADLVVLGNTSGVNTGDQTISDVTISTSDITTNNASTAKHGFLKKLSNSATEFMNGQGDWATPAGVGDMVLASAQTNTGAKTFNANTLLDKGSMVFNVKAYGAVGDDSTDDTTAIQDAVDAAGAVGGVVWFPAGTYKITTSLKLYNATPNPDVPYSNITLAGAGASEVGGGTIIKQYTTGEDVIHGLNNITNGVQLLNVEIRDMNLTFGGTPSNSGNGIYLKQVAADGPAFQGMLFKNLTITQCKGSGKYGFNVESLITSSLINVKVQECANGFFLNGGAFGGYDSINTSVTFLNTYANGNVGKGYRIYRSTYISFVGAACDYDTGTGIGYDIDDCSAVSINGSGGETPSTYSGTFYKFTDSVSCGLYSCFTYGSNGIAVDVATSTVTIVGFDNNTPNTSGTTGLNIGAGAEVTDIGSNWAHNATPATLVAVNATGVYKTPGTPRRVAVSNDTTPTINVGATDVYEDTGLTGNVTDVDISGTPEAGQKLIVSFTGTATRTIAWSATYFEASGGVALPTTTSGTARLDVGFVYNSATSKFRCVASA